MITDCSASNSSHDFSKVDQDTASSPQFEPFEIVLVDIQRTMTDKKICCVKKKLEPDIDLKYVAISYRWGEVDEQLAVTPDYTAHITSFDIGDFMKLCKAISKEADLHTMQYVWVDAICVDQLNETRRKETIYHMTEIYEYANWILAVPDLHLRYLMNNPLHQEVIYWMDCKAEYVYHIIMENGDRVEEMDNLWMKQLGIPRHLQCHLRTRQFDDSEEDCEEALFQGLVQLDLKQGNTNDPLNYWHATKKMIKGQRAIDDRYKNLERALEFLKHQYQDWTQRTWVISEYSIAEKKNNGIIKYWYTSLDSCIPDGSSSTFKFFQADPLPEIFDLQATTNRYLSLTVDSLTMGAYFRYCILGSMILRTFPEKLFESKASKNSDRFSAIVPHYEKYRHHIKNKNSVKNWKITDMVSVRMRFRKWLTVQENIGLLYTLEYNEISILLPSFDFHQIRLLQPDAGQISLLDLFLYYNEPEGIQFNYDLTNPNQCALIIKDKADESNDSIPVDDDATDIQLRYSMLLYPKFYKEKHISFIQKPSNIISDSVWKVLDIDPSVDLLTWLRVPFRIKMEGPISPIECLDPFFQPSSSGDPPPEGILNLIGTHRKNMWIVITPGSEVLTTEYIRSLDDWIWCQRGADELRIY